MPSAIAAFSSFPRSCQNTSIGSLSSPCCRKWLVAMLFRYGPVSVAGVAGAVYRVYSRFHPRLASQLRTRMRKQVQGRSQLPPRPLLLFSDGVNRLFTLLIATEHKSMDGELATAAKQTSISRFAGVALLRKYKEHVEHFHDAVV